MPAAPKSPININSANKDKLRNQAKREGGLNKNGEIKVSWLNSKINNPRTSEAVRKRAQFAKNARKWN